MTTLLEIFQNSENWLRLVTLTDYAGVDLCKEVLHTKEGLPTDGVKLYQKLKKDYNIKGLYREQEQIVFPKDENTDEGKFDITLYTCLIQQMFPSKYKGLMRTLRDIRNGLCHMSDKKIPESDFQKRWNSICAKLQNHGFNKSVDKLKTGYLPSIEMVKKILESIMCQCQDGFKEIHVHLDEITERIVGNQNENTERIVGNQNATRSKEELSAKFKVEDKYEIMTELIFQSQNEKTEKIIGNQNETTDMITDWIIQNQNADNATKARRLSKEEIKKELINFLIDNEKVETEGLNEQAAKVENSEDVATIKKYEDIILAKKKNIIDIEYHQGKVFRRFKDKEKFIKLVKQFKVHKTKMIFEISTAKLINKYPELMKSSVTLNF